MTKRNHSRFIAVGAVVSLETNLLGRGQTGFEAVCCQSLLLCTGVADTDHDDFRI
jgi:hypothetical protein